VAEYFDKTKRTVDKELENQLAYVKKFFEQLKIMYKNIEVFRGLNH